MMYRFVVASALIVTTTLPAQQEPSKPGSFPGEEKRVREDLDQAHKLAEEKRWDEAVRRYQQILSDSGDLLVPVEPQRSLPARWLVHQRLAQLEPAGRQLYRQRMEETARRWLEQGKKERDWRLLDQVVAEAFCTHAAEQALMVLGDLAFERGEFAAAERFWRLLILPASQQKAPLPARTRFQLVHPDPQGEPALARAKQILALIFAGATDAAQLELAEFQKAHGTVVGTFAGRTAKYADVLRSFLDAHAHATLQSTGADSNSWTTYGGDGARNRISATAQTPYWPPLAHWQFTFPGDPQAKPRRDADPPLGTSAASRALAFHPIVVGGHVLVADACRVWAFDVKTGKQTGAYDHRKTNAMPKSLDLRVPTRTDVRYTLTASGNRVYARFGAQPLQSSSDKDLAAIDTWIVCLELAATATGVQLQFRWQLRGRLLDSDTPALFEGAPLLYAGRLYVARTRFDGRQTITSIDCFDADTPENRVEPPPLRWSVDVWNTESSGPADGARHRHDLLTLAGSNVVLCTHSGAMIAVDAQSGRRTWATRYPSVARAELDGMHPRDLSPAVYDSGRLYVAPVDANRLFCFDAATGDQLWESNPVQVVQVLGVARRRLFATVGGYPHGLRAYDALRGQPLWTKPDDGDLATFGRGFLTAHWVFWPTTHGLRVLRQEDGELLDAGSNSQTLGNLAFGEGCLVAASPTELLGFVPERFRLSQRQADAAEQPENELAQLQLAFAHADAGDAPAALGLLQRIEASGTADQYFAGQSVLAAARRLRHELLMRLAEKHWRTNQRDHALKLLHEATKKPFAPADRIRALYQVHAAGAPLPNEWVQDPELSAAWVTTADGKFASGHDALLRLLDEPGIQALESRVQPLISTDFSAAMQFGPGTKVVRAECIRRAQRAEQTQDWSEALLRYRQALWGANFERDGQRRDLDRHTAQTGIQRQYTKLGFEDAARWSRYPLVPLDEPIEPVAAATPKLDLPGRWERSFSMPLQPRTERLLRPFASATQAASFTVGGHAFFSNGVRVVCRALADGKVLWTAAVSHEPEQFAEYADTVIVAGPAGVSRIRRADGLTLWHVTIPDARPLAGQFPEAAPVTLVPGRTSGDFGEFQIGGGRLVFRFGAQLVAVELETGGVLWQRDAPGAPVGPGSFQPKFLTTPRSVLAQTMAGQLLLIDAQDGRIRWRRDVKAGLWTTAPLLANSQHAIVPFDAENLVCLDLTTGMTVWEQNLAGATSLSGSLPQLRRDGSALALVVERNYGYEWEQRSLETGQRILGPVFLGRDFVDLSAAGFAAEQYCFASRGQLRAFQRDSGTAVWTTALPAEAEWYCVVTQADLILAPRAALTATHWKQVEDALARNLLGLPSVARYHAAGNLLYHVFMDRKFPVLRVDLSTGKTVDLLEFATPGCHAALVLGPRAAAVIVDGTLFGIRGK